MTDGNRRAILAALAANLGITVAKFGAFLATGSSAMLAESVHSVADTGNQALLLLGAARARQEPTDEHAFGFGAERYFWSFVVALVLFSLGSLFALFEGIEKLRHPHSVESPAWAVGVLCVAIVFESLSFRTAIVEANRVRGDEGWWDYVRRARSPELPVVLLEDLGALMGLVIALLAVSLTMALGDARFDAIGTLAIGVLLGAIAAVLAIEMKSLLIGESARPRVEDSIRRAIEGAPAVRKLIHLRTRHLGPDDLLVAGKIELDASLGFSDVARHIDAIEARIRERVPAARFIFLEPDVYRDPAAAD